MFAGEDPVAHGRPSREEDEANQGEEDGMSGRVPRAGMGCDRAANDRHGDGDQGGEKYLVKPGHDQSCVQNTAVETKGRCDAAPV
jgi:hypothetical protein